MLQRNFRTPGSAPVQLQNTRRDTTGNMFESRRVDVSVKPPRLPPIQQIAVFRGLETIIGSLSPSSANRIGSTGNASHGLFITLCSTRRRVQRADVSVRRTPARPLPDELQYSGG